MLLSMRGIEKRFAGVAALSGATLEVAPGEAHALIGQNGAGKSTLIKILTGYHRCDAGTMEFDGQPLDPRSPAEAQGLGISTIHQEINLVGYRSVTENICLGRESRRFGLLDWRAMHREAQAALARLGLEIDVRRPLADYTTAVQQMVAIARALGFRAKLVVMDEPTSSLDDREVAVLFDVIRRLKADGVSVVFVSHKLDELYAVCDRVTVMRDGRTVRVAPMDGITRLQLVSDMLGRDVADSEATGAAAQAAQAGEEVLAIEGLHAPPRVRGASLAVRRGEIVGLAGLLGAGRSETVRVAFGADAAADAGQLRFEGRAFAPTEPREAIRAGIGFCSEDRKVESIVPEMSVRENLTLALLPHLARAGVVDEVRQREVVDRFIRRLGVRCAGPDQPIRELSGGNQQKVLLARWLCMDPKLLILDEPTRGIDVGAKAEIQALIRELAEGGLAVLMVSSEVKEIVDGADRAYVMRDGRTVAELSGARLTEDALMAAMAHGPHEAVLAEGAPHE
jgi:ribose transport system ATP-binding protein